MQNCKKAVTPIATNCLMDSDETGQQVDSIEYRGLVFALYNNN